MAKKLKIGTCLECHHCRVVENDISTHKAICYHKEINGREIVADTMDFLSDLDFPDWCPLEDIEE